MTLRLVTATDAPLVHDCDSYRCAWRGYAPKAPAVRWLISMCPGARMVKRADMKGETQ